MRGLSHRVALAGVAMLLVALAAGWAVRVDAQTIPVEPKYDYYSVFSIADGVTAQFVIKGFLPIEELVALSSVSSEAHLGVSRSDALAAMPDPGDLILTLPSTLSALLGLSGLPDYPAAASAVDPVQPEDEVVLVPDAGLGAGTLRAAATPDGSSANAFVGKQVDTIGLLPSFSIGSIETSAETRRLRGTVYETIATSTVSDVRLLGGLVRIDQITSQATATVVDDVLTAQATEVDISGAEIAGTPVGITEKGIVGLGQPLALAPVIGVLTQPLKDAGLHIATTPATKETSAGLAHAEGGTLTIEVPLTVRGYPASYKLTIGTVTADLQVGSLDSGTPPVFDDDAKSSPLIPSDPGSTGSSTGSVTQTTRPSTSPSQTNGNGGYVAMPVTREIADWDVVAVYRMMLVTGLLMAAISLFVIRSSQTDRSDLRSLWRW